VEQDLPSPIPARSDRGMNGGRVSTRWGQEGRARKGGQGYPVHIPFPPFPPLLPPSPPPRRGGPDVADLLREDVPMLQIF
jgi:hypothetical protein